MTISDYQISNVIRTYVKNMMVKVKPGESLLEAEEREDNVRISQEGMKRMLFERIGEKMTEKLKRHATEE